MFLVFHWFLFYSTVISNVGDIPGIRGIDIDACTQFIER